ncbi:hypothetical protein Suden_0250 [Sulfurimonas denitrificans DSM 1251]|uniref:Uncharacterized protein n=1 Tax=Sulfurimonas denitrificans (strain ATCC 33889 / DSM 1251) TaxID=326298 RepID=Q30U00_SULDN|nr:hypothetical protein [Sulfurimonas denitrificans]ABB43531.1 hypothetical protein Suden_0250 [Sulfurimonas denitrificans DSM 1251]MDD3443460.1 hypothetical protein [Sulfurimonas denitrificans]
MRYNIAMKYNIKLFVAALLTIFLILFIWRASYHYGCYTLLLPIIVLFIISHSFVELKMQERFCFRDCYFVEKSFFANLLSSRSFVVIFYIILSLLMTISLIYAVIDFKMFFWIYLIFQLLFATFIFKWFKKILSLSIKQSFLSLFSRELSINISSILLLLVYVYISLEGYAPEYLRETLKETQVVASNTISSSCYITNYILKVKIEIDSIFWWSFSSFAEHIDNTLLKSIAWFGFIFMNGLAILGLNRFILQIVYYLDKLFSRDAT